MYDTLNVQKDIACITSFDDVERSDASYIFQN